MSTRIKSRDGFAVIELALVVVMIALIGYIVLMVYRHQQAAVPTESTTAIVSSAPQISSLSGLDQANTTLDQTDIDSNSTDSIKLSSQLTNF